MRITRRSPRVVDKEEQEVAGSSVRGLDWEGNFSFCMWELKRSAVPGEPVIPPPPQQPAAKPASTSTTQVDTSEVKPDIDPNQPQTTIQLRLADGTRLVTQFNLSSTMESLYSFVASARPTGGREFVLQTIFPTRVLERSNKTIEEESLKNGTVVMRWKS
jgi:UBX domain-containing protein 1